MAQLTANRNASASATAVPTAPTGTIMDTVVLDEHCILDANLWPSIIRERTDIVQVELIIRAILADPLSRKRSPDHHAALDLVERLKTHVAAMP